MQKISITILITVSIVVGLTVASHTSIAKRLINPHPSEKQISYIHLPSYIHKLNTKAAEAQLFAKKNNFNAGLCFLIDMDLPSGRKRFFVYDMQKDSIITSGLVAHGNCNQFWLDGRKYDNAIGCGCTSLGKYKIGYSYTGRFGLAFKLYGLEKTNSNAFARYVVLHSYEDVPETEVETDICQSNGIAGLFKGTRNNN